MNNLTNKVLTLKNGKNYLILRQATYKAKTYFFAAELTDDTEDYTNNFIFLEQIDEDGVTSVKILKDKEIIEILLKNIKLD